MHALKKVAIAVPAAVVAFAGMGGVIEATHPAAHAKPPAVVVKTVTVKAAAPKAPAHKPCHHKHHRESRQAVAKVETPAHNTDTYADSYATNAAKSIRPVNSHYVSVPLMPPKKAPKAKAPAHGCTTSTRTSVRTTTGGKHGPTRSVTVSNGRTCK